MKIMIMIKRMLKRMMRRRKNEKSAKKYLQEFRGEYIGVAPLYSGSEKKGEIKVVVKKRSVKLQVATEDEEVIYKFPTYSFFLMSEKEKEDLILENTLGERFAEVSMGFFSRYFFKGGYPKIIFSLEAAAKENEPVLLVALNGVSELIGLARLYESQKKDLHESTIKEIEKRTGKPVFRLCSAY